MDVSKGNANNGAIYKVAEYLGCQASELHTSHQMMSSNGFTFGAT
jgi:hypothetical protein